MSQRMTPTEYIEAVLVTEAIDFDKIKERLSRPGMIRLLHSAMGLCTEAGEFVDQLKKAIFYGKDVDLINLFEELGDLLWYTALAMDEIGLPMEECFERNIAKLQARYKGKFGETKAENRDLVAERVILEGAADGHDVVCTGHTTEEQPIVLQDVNETRECPLYGGHQRNDMGVCECGSWAPFHKCGSDDQELRDALDKLPDADPTSNWRAAPEAIPAVPRLAKALRALAEKWPRSNDQRGLNNAAGILERAHAKLLNELPKR